jgi:hypothetical protein
MLDKIGSVCVICFIFCSIFSLLSTKKKQQNDTFILDPFWEDIANYVSFAKIMEMAVNLFPNIRKSTLKKTLAKKSPKSKQAIEKNSGTKRKRTSGGATTVQKKSKTKK